MTICPSMYIAQYIRCSFTAQWFPRGKWMKRMRHCMWNQNLNLNPAQDQDKTGTSKPSDSSAPSGQCLINR